MMNKLSEKLSESLKSKPDSKEVVLQIMFNNRLNQEDKGIFLKKLANVVNKNELKEVTQGSGVVVTASPLKNVKSIVEQPEVDWVDLDSVAPLNELMD